MSYENLFEKYPSRFILLGALTIMLLLVLNTMITGEIPSVEKSVLMIGMSIFGVLLAMFIVMDD